MPCTGSNSMPCTGRLQKGPDPLILSLMIVNGF